MAQKEKKTFSFSGNIYVQVTAYVAVVSLKVLTADLKGDMILSLAVWEPVLVVC